MKRARRFVWVCVALPATLLGVGAWWVAHELRPVSDHPAGLVVRIKPGSGAQRIARSLKEAGVIRNESVFLWFARQRPGAAFAAAIEVLPSPYAARIVEPRHPAGRCDG